MTVPGDPPSLTPTLTEYLGELAALTGRDITDPHMESLAEAVATNESAFALVDGSARLPSDDPFDFVRSLRAWGERGER